MVEKFTDDDKMLLTNLISRAFRAQRMGNDADRNRQVTLIDLYYGAKTAKCVRNSLREDRRYTEVHSVGISA
jgi:hypothetical protein